MLSSGIICGEEMLTNERIESWNRTGIISSLNRMYPTTATWVFGAMGNQKLSIMKRA